MIDLPFQTFHIDRQWKVLSNNRNTLFPVIDLFTKYLCLYPTKSTDTAEVLAKLDHQKSIFRNPTSIISDRDTTFSYNFDGSMKTSTCTEFLYFNAYFDVNLKFYFV